MASDRRYRTGAAALLAGLAACGQTADVVVVHHGAQASAAAAVESAPPIDERFAERMRAIRAEYLTWGRVDDELRWAPYLCRMPLPGTGRISASDDAGTHGRKLYYLYARDREAYVRATPAIDAVGQVVVKEAWRPEPVVADGVMATRLDGEHLRPFAIAGEQWYRPAEPAGLFVMMRLDPSTPGTDGGWVYGTVTADGVVTAAGELASCIRCHRRAENGRLFGLQGQ